MTVSTQKRKKECCGKEIPITNYLLQFPGEEAEELLREKNSVVLINIILIIPMGSSYYISLSREINKIRAILIGLCAGWW